MKLVFDIGNSLVKAGVFEKKQLLYIKTSASLSEKFIKSISRKYNDITSVILSSVRKIPAKEVNYLKKNFHFILFSTATSVPVANLYKTPETLGNDRLAGVVAAYSMYPSENVLVIDAGTCITYDFINEKGEYRGGGISPGLSMRFKALNTFTEKLPLVSLINFKELVGTNTEKSILSGVINGTVSEVDAIINQYGKRYSSLKTIICGGDSRFFADRLKNRIFAIPELVLKGLNEILDYNEL